MKLTADPAGSGEVSLRPVPVSSPDAGRSRALVLVRSKRKVDDAVGTVLVAPAVPARICPGTACAAGRRTVSPVSAAGCSRVRLPAPRRDLAVRHDAYQAAEFVVQPDGAAHQKSWEGQTGPL